MMRWIFLALGLLWIASACTKAETCKAGCDGCCDSTGECRPGTALDACGLAGAKCGQCDVHQGCIDRSCQADPNSVDGGGAGSDAGSTADAGPTHYPDGGGLSRSWDGGSCAVKTECPCFSSDDCGPGFFCHSEDSTGLHVYCVPGARGAGLVGETCASEADCLSALCTDSASAGMRCSAVCDVAPECPPTLPHCTFIGFGVDRSICSP